MAVDWAHPGVTATDEGEDGGSAELCALVRRAMARDRQAYAILYQRLCPMVHGVLLASAPAYEVGDLVQDVFCRGWAQLPGLRKPASIGPWLAAIARRRAADVLRERARQPEPPPLVTTPAFAESLALLDAIRALPDAHREPLILRLVEGLTGPEIAEQTGKTHRSVRVNLHRGMKLLRARLAGEERDDR